MRNIVWIASYPKSGNTWLRVFFSNLMNDSCIPLNINELIKSPIASNRYLFDNITGVNSSDLTEDEISNLRPRVYRFLSSESDKLVFIKVHDSWRTNSEGCSLFPEDITKAVIYIVRNPLDVAVSFAFHNNESFGTSIKKMNNPHFEIDANPSKLNSQLNQYLSSWSNHLKSWIDDSDLPVYVIRYEDMLSTPQKSFSALVSFLELQYTEESIQKAIENSEFDLLKEQEQKYGFKEKPLKSKSFFREGKLNSWNKYISVEGSNKMIKAHRAMMKRYGYIE